MLMLLVFRLCFDLHVVAFDLDCLFELGWWLFLTFRVGCISFGGLGLWVCGLWVFCLLRLACVIVVGLISEATMWVGGFIVIFVLLWCGDFCWVLVLFVCLGFGSANFCTSGLGCRLSVGLGIGLVGRFGVLLTLICCSGSGVVGFVCCWVVCSGWFIAGFVSLLLLYCFNSVVGVLTLLFDWFNCLLILIALV